LKDILDIFTRE